MLLLAVVLLVIGFFIFTGNLTRSQPIPEGTADGIAVLTGGVARIDEAMKLLAQGKAKRLLITGVNRTTSTEALKQLASEGDQLFTCCVDIDKEARNTIDNATETSQWVARNRYHSIIVVTSNYHMPRALAELARVMPGVDPDSLRGRGQQRASRPLVDLSRHHQAAALRISEIPAGAGAARRHPAREQDHHRQVDSRGRGSHRAVTSALAMARSVLFNILFFVTTTLFVVIGSPFLFLPRSWAMAALKVHARFELFLLRLIIGTKIEVRGREKIPDGPCLVASKHQSAWETFALIPIFRDPALLMKRELFWIPFHGWFSYKFQMIPVDRDKGPTALRRMLREAKKRIEDGREIIIFPEGTRRAPGAPPDYKTGIVLLYDALGVPCLPVALNSGLFWPRRSVIRRPGTIVVEILDPIPPSLPKAEFLRRLETAIEGASNRLLVEGGAPEPARG